MYEITWKTVAIIFMFWLLLKLSGLSHKIAHNFLVAMVTYKLPSYNATATVTTNQLALY